MEHKELLIKLEDYEALNVRRLHTINHLEARVKQQTYAVKQGRSRAPRGLEGVLEDDESCCDSETTGGALLAELGPAGALAPDENLVEVWVVSVDLCDGLLSPGDGDSLGVLFQRAYLPF